MDYLTPKTPEIKYHTYCYMNTLNHPNCMTSFGGHFGILLIERVTYSCQSDNQARVVLK